MKLWPEDKRKKVLLLSIIVIVLVVASISVYVLIKADGDFASDLDVLNPNGSQTVLVLYHDGFSSFTKDAIYALGDGLVENGWRVEITTASDKAPTDLAKYSLLVLGSPVYGGSPSASIERHLVRIGDLKEIESVGVVTSGGINAGAEDAMHQLIEEYNGVVKTVLSMQTGDSLDVAEQTGKEVFPQENN